MAGLQRKISIIVFIFGIAAQAFGADNQGPQADAARTLKSIKQIDDFPLYEMYFFGDYGFSNFLKQGIEGDLSQAEITHPDREPTFLCTCFTAANGEGGRIFGRNFDWQHHPALILFTDPPHAYASVSVVDISYLGVSSQNKPTGKLNQRLLEAPFYPFDGMNEWGLAVGMNAISYSDGVIDPALTTIGSLHVIRLLLDYAKNVDEALALLRNYNVQFREVPIHYLVADTSGNSALIEFIDGETRIIRNQAPYQVTTNFVITDTPPGRRLQSCWRYAKVFRKLETSDGILSQNEAWNLLKDVAQAGESSTIWSIVYGMSSGNIQIVMDRKFDQVHTFKLKLKKCSHPHTHCIMNAQKGLKGKSRAILSPKPGLFTSRDCCSCEMWSMKL